MTIPQLGMLWSAIIGFIAIVILAINMWRTMRKGVDNIEIFAMIHLGAGITAGLSWASFIVFGIMMLIDYARR